MISRQQALAGLREEELDVIVVGGGITGAGVALDAASRGYSVALIERNDFASGTSSRSSKLVHGGLRYLQSFDLGLVREALLERRLLARMAPHLVRPLPLVVAAFGGARPDRLIGVGLNLYDVMSVERSQLRLRRRRRRSGGEREELEEQEAGDSASGAAGSVVVGDPAAEEAWSPRRHRQIGGEEALALLPALSERKPTGGYLFYDCQTDDARLVQCVLAEADRWGAIIVNRVAATELIEHAGRAVGVIAEDLLSSERLRLLAPNVVNATGVWADELRAGELREAAEVPQIRPSRGTHLIFDRDDLPLVGGAILPAGQQRSIFALPWLGSTLIGTTDNDYQGSLEHVAPAGEEIDYLLDAVNSFFARDLKRSDIAGAYAGVRPLISSADAKKSVDISRKAELYETASGLITITGGKLTTWRRMAKLTVDRLVEREAREAPCRTQEMRLGNDHLARGASGAAPLPEGSQEHLAARYGPGGAAVAALAEQRRELADPILPGHPDLLAEVVHAAREEQACSVADVLLRRTRLALLAPRLLLGDAQSSETAARRTGLRSWRQRGGAGSGALEQIAELLGSELGWGRRERAAEIERFRREALAEGLIPEESPAEAAAAGAAD